MRLSDDDLATVRKSVFFSSLPDTVFDAVARHSSIVIVGLGQSLFREGEHAAFVYAVLDGLVKLSVTSQDGTDIVVEIFHPGTSFAEALVFRQAPYPVTATALVESRVFAVSNQIVSQEIKASPDAFGAILGSTYVHLHKLVKQIELLKSNSGLERVARFVLALSNSAGGVGTFNIPYEKQVLASLLGIKPETLSRAFRRLEEHGVVLEGRKITLADESALQRFLE